MQDAIIEEFMNLSIMLKEGKLNINDIERLAIESYKKIVTNPSKEIADFYNVSKSLISQACTGKIKTAIQYIWKYKEAV